MQGQLGDCHSARPQPVQHLPGEVKPSGGRSVPIRPSARRPSGSRRRPAAGRCAGCRAAAARAPAFPGGPKSLHSSGSVACARQTNPVRPPLPPVPPQNESARPRRFCVRDGPRLPSFLNRAAWSAAPPPAGSETGVRLDCAGSAAAREPRCGSRTGAPGLHGCCSAPADRLVSAVLAVQQSRGRRTRPRPAPAPACAKPHARVAAPGRSVPEAEYSQSR